MASTSGVSSSKFYKENGYIFVEDESIGNLVTHLEDLSLSDDAILDKAKSVLLQIESAVSILQPYLNRPHIQLCHALGPDPGHRFVFSLQTGMTDRIILHICSPKFDAEFYQASHTGTLPVAAAANGLLEVPGAALRRRGNTPIPVTMDTGGIAIHDLRYVFQIKSGSTISWDLKETEQEE
ncbi:hypothetical protein PGQ11_002828 [Apiospora arundinis]|uniref:Uncharacterized protein n=1 Tax=Apiospora arundinis TaxID=335852 RepID=A0ABR2J384_9PEZI